LQGIFFERLPEKIVAPIAARGPNHAKSGWQEPFALQIVQRWNQFAVGQIAGRAKYHNCAWLGGAVHPQAKPKRVGRLFRHDSSQHITTAL
jgi:hypothetical protein